MIFIGIPGGNGGDVAGKELLSFITEGDKKVILPIPIKRSYYFHPSKRIFGYFGNECSMIIYMMNKFIIALSSKIQLLILYDINTAVIFRQSIIRIQ